ncbi:UPF0149 family protein [Alkalilimnicola sp. S0819]|uniref:UPF0149 family protein n=1 Tax=Alkalilimnicola sp. S0819 TaxID=2613922 RepID=UPI0012614FD9|nr:UPF0149 family protein [Alkalilimnicola sp. S0819]KAB7628208.1 UPF0149 family protein [Alkalilimnicola sp. S0819]MPQ15099.1 UPF0149 family protein [Alkalilimnicola sp. S0819]
MSAGMDYDQVQQALQGVGAAVDAAESQGLLSGMVAAPDKVEPAPWVAQVLAETEPRGETAKACLAALGALYEHTLAGMEDKSLGFQLLLPDDQETLPRRAEALGRWCEGFLVGLGISGLKSEAELPREVREILQDFSQITRVELEPDAEEDNEEAYAELVEYVRVASLLVLEHLRPSGRKVVNPPKDGDEEPTVH